MLEGEGGLCGDRLSSAVASASEEIDESWNGKASLKHLLQHQPSSLSGILTFSYANSFGMEPVEAGFTEDTSFVGLR